MAARHAIPALYFRREFAVAGGLMAYGSNFAEFFSIVGLYAGQILKGVKPSELPVQQPTKFELVINLRTAKVLGLVIPPMLLARRAGRRGDRIRAALLRLLRSVRGRLCCKSRFAVAIKKSTGRRCSFRVILRRLR